MKAAILRANYGYPTIEHDFFIDPPDDYVKIKIDHAALNHRDLWICKGKYSNIKYPIILGSDGCGTWENRKVIINPGLFWGNNEAYQSNEFRIIGLPDHGTFAEYCYVPKTCIFNKPEHLNSAQAAALPLAGVTAYRALFIKGRLKATDKVLINGAGGGVAQMGFTMAKAIGCEVYVTSGSDEKLEKLVHGGAAGGANYKDQNYIETLAEMAGRFDVILDSAAGDSLSAIFPLCNYGARVVIYGGTTGNIAGLSPQILYWRQIELLGTTMGSPKDFSEMLNFVNTYKLITPVDEVYALDDIEMAIRKMETGKQMGKIVIAIS